MHSQDHIQRAERRLKMTAQKYIIIIISFIRLQNYSENIYSGKFSFLTLSEELNCAYETSTSDLYSHAQFVIWVFQIIKITVFYLKDF